MIIGLIDALGNALVGRSKWLCITDTPQYLSALSNIVPNVRAELAVESSLNAELGSKSAVDGDLCTTPTFNAELQLRPKI